MCVAAMEIPLLSRDQRGKAEAVRLSLHLVSRDQRGLDARLAVSGPFWRCWSAECGCFPLAGWVYRARVSAPRSLLFSSLSLPSVTTYCVCRLPPRLLVKRLEIFPCCWTHHGEWKTRRVVLG